MRTAVILFSKNRAMQVDATLRSFARHCLDPDQAAIQVLFRADPHHEASYARLAAEHPGVSFVREGNFKQQLLAMMQSAEFVLFVVDDTFFVRSFAIAAMNELLRSHPQAAGYSLRLGTNTTYNYVAAKPQALPAFEPVADGVLRYDWTRAKGNFAYPLEVSSSLYRTAELVPKLAEANFKTPNTLEYSLARRASGFRATHPWLLCPKVSAAFCSPVNKVQTNFKNNRESESYHYEPDDLNRFYEAGRRIDVSRYDGWISNSCHQEVPLHFIEP